MTTTRRAHPSAFMFLIAPFGVLGGYLTVAIAFLLQENHVGVGPIAALMAWPLVPNFWKFLWAPIADVTLSPKRWYVLSAVVTAAGVFATGLPPMTAAALPVLTLVTIVANVACTFMGMSTQALMAYDVPEDEKGRAGGWFQAGNLGGTGIGGGLGLLLAERLPAVWMSGAILAVLCLLCALPILWIEDPEVRHGHGPLQSVRFVLADIWNLSRARLGLLALVLCFMPIGSGAASGLWSAVAGDWHASANAVALVTGVLGGVIMAVGSLVGGWICDRMNRKGAYALFGVLEALAAVLMAAMRHDERNYVVWTSVYGFVVGLTYAGFTAFVLEAMGTGAAATKFSLFASLSNFPIWYMTLIDGRAHGRWGPSGMLYAEAVVGVLGLLAFVAFAASVQRFWPAHWPQRVEETLPASGPAAASP